MRQFQSVRSAYCLKSGLREDGSDPDKMSGQEFRDLLDKVKNRRFH